MANDDMDEWMNRDKQKLKNIASGGSGIGRPSTPKIIEGILWTLTGVSALSMVMVLPFIGPDGILTGAEWLGFFLPMIALLGGGAIVVRMLPTEV